MQLLIVIEALKIHKMKHEKAVQIWFVILYAINLLPFVLPFGDRDFSEILLVREEMLSGQMPEQSVFDMLTTGNLVVFAMMAAAGLITLFFSYMYANLFVSERQEGGPDQAFKISLNAVPKLILFGLLLIIPAMFSMFAAFIPLIIFLLMMYMLPMYLAWTKKSLFDAMRHSYDATKGHKASLFFQLIFASLIISLPQNLILGFIEGTGLPYLLLASFFIVFRAFVFGRLMGLLYFLLVKKEVVIIKPKPKNND